MKHPGKTPAQRRVLDSIGCGERSPYMTKATREAMLRAGLIVELSPLEIPFGGLGHMKVRQFEMPIPVHIEWCLSADGEPTR